MTAAERLAREVTKTRTHEEALAVAEGFMARKRREKRTRIPKPAMAARMKPTKEANASREDRGKTEARLRSGGICEWHTDGRRCFADATDCDHVIGGRWKVEMEALPNGEGFMHLCNFHHIIEKHGDDKPESLAVAKEHALRIGSKGLLRHVELAMARYVAKHPEAR